MIYYDGYGMDRRIASGLGVAPLLVVAAPYIITGAVTAGTAIGQYLSRGCGSSCIDATNHANAFAVAVEDNLNAFRDGLKTQAQALDDFDYAWAILRGPNGCGNSALGPAGDRCISERARGGSAPWCPTGTGCDAFAQFRDPIANAGPELTSLPILAPDGRVANRRVQTSAQSQPTDWGMIAASIAGIAGVAYAVGAFE